MSAIMEAPPMPPQVAKRVKTKVKEEIKYSPRYQIIFYNNDKTPFDFVIATLITFLHHNKESAYKVTKEIHEEGKGVVFINSLELCELKYEQVKEFCKFSREKFLKYNIEEVPE